MKLEINNLEDLMACSHASKFWEILKFAIEIDLFDLIGSGIELAVLANKLHCDIKKISHAIQILRISGLINIDNDYIANSSLATHYLTNKYSNKISNLLLYNAKTSFSAEEYRCILKLRANSIKNTSDDELYMSAMDIGNKYSAVKIASKLLRGENKILLDLGCGSGIFSIMACKYNESLRSVCVDKKNILPILEKKLAALPKINNHITLMEGEISSLNLNKLSFDYILLSNVLHFFQPIEIAKILSNCEIWLKKTGKIIINDIFTSEGNIINSLFSLEWLSNGNDFIELREMKSMLKKVGFVNIDSLHYKQLPTDIVFAEKY